MHKDEIDQMLTSAVPVPAPGRRRAVEAASLRSLTENSVYRGHVGHFEGHRSDSFFQWNDRSPPAWLFPQTPREDRRRDVHSNEGL